MVSRKTPIIDRKNIRYGNLVAIEPARTKGDRLGWMCVCDCGEIVVVDSSALGIGNSTSCGKCGRKKRSENNGKNWLKHGEHNTPLHRCWSAIIRRTRYQEDYKNVNVCQEWQDYTIFSEWARCNGWEEGLTIDRIENSKGYEPSNCRFATRAEQARNRTTTKLDWDKVMNIRKIVSDGVLSRLEIANIFRISHKTVSDIILNKRWAVSATDTIVS